MEKEPALRGENTNYNRKIYRNDLISWGYSQNAKAFVEQNCEPPIAVVDREAMTESKWGDGSVNVRTRHKPVSLSANKERQIRKRCRWKNGKLSKFVIPTSVIN